jgi:hypothetical protein
MVCCPAAAPNRAAGRRLELQDIFRQFGHELSALTVQQAKVVRDMLSCRTDALGGHMHQCDHCGHRQEVYNSCGNRHCPKCQNADEARWLQARMAELLPVQYFHVVFTVPEELKPIFLKNKEVCYGLLFEAASETLKEVALNPRNLGARIGFTAVLHTWTQKLLYHPHIHCIVPGGGLNSDDTTWVSAKPGYFLPIPVLKLVFRGKLLNKLEQGLAEGKIRPSAQHPVDFLQHAACRSWIVYCKPPFAGPKEVLRYLARYAYRIAISNDRLVASKSGQVTFRWKDRTDGNKVKLMTLDAVDFMRRFLLHVLSKGFMRIRHYGFLANGVKAKSIELCRRLLGVNGPLDQPDPIDEQCHELLQRLTGVDVTLCPICKTGHMVRKNKLATTPSRWTVPGRATSP